MGYIISGYILVGCLLIVLDGRYNVLLYFVTSSDSVCVHKHYKLTIYVERYFTHKFHCL